MCVNYVWGLLRLSASLGIGLTWTACSDMQAYAANTESAFSVSWIGETGLAGLSQNSARGAADARPQASMDGAQEPGAAATPATATPATATPALTKGRFAFSLVAGVEFAQDKEEFSETTPLVTFHGDTAWGTTISEFRPIDSGFRCVPGDVHTTIDLGFSAIPTEEQNAGGTPAGIVTSRKAITAQVGLDWRPLHFPLDDVGSQSELFVGPSIRVGLQSLAEREDGSDVDSVNNFELVGFRLGEFDATQQSDNPVLTRWVAVYYGNYESFGHDRVAVEAVLTIADSGLFVGTSFIGGSGPDDLRFFVGFTSSFSKLVASIGDVVGAIFPTREQ